jgi:capsular exopolysaccharide synthesis family protein
MNANRLLDDVRGLYENRTTGTVTLSSGQNRIDVFYREGLILAASSSLQSYLLGDYLTRSGHLTAGDIKPVLDYAHRHRIHFGEAAVRRKFLDAAELAQVVQRQAIDLMRHAFENGFASKGFATTFRSFYAPANIHLGQLLLEIARSSAAPSDCDPYVMLMLVENSDLSQLGWYPEEVAILGELTSPVNIDSLKQSTGLKETTLRKILGVFNALGLLRTLAYLESTEDGHSRASDRNMAVMKRPAFPFDGLIPTVNNAAVSDKLEVLKNGSSFISEQFKNLKVRIRDSGEAPPKVLTVSSAEHQDGKSLISANLALSFSMETGKRVIVIDCDLRNPSLHKYLGVTDEPGLVQYLGNGHIGPHCYVRRLENLFFLTSGGVAENPIELLSLRKMKDLVEYLKNDFDTIILDAPPFNPIADARIVTGLSDSYLMVVRRGRTSYSSLQNAFRVMDQQKLLGVVFNDVQPMLFNTAYTYSYYGYGHGAYVGYGKSKPRASKRYLE